MTPAPEGSDVILERLAQLHPKLIDLSLGRMTSLLDQLGNPENQLPPVVHIAGTNGKGSVLAMLRAMLEAAGKKVHVYTSPHLVRFHERIRLAGDLIDEDHLAALLEECEEANEGAAITFFEITTAAAFLAFSRAPADILLLETGLGGRLDATNVVAKPTLTVITPVSMDHASFLGDTIAEIAWEKAGIIKPGLPLVLARQEPEAAAAIRARAGELQASVYAQDSDWSVRSEVGMLHFEGASGRFELPLPNLLGAHQIGNAGTALAAMERLRRPRLGDAAVAKGLRSAQWPGRLQQLDRGPLVDALPRGWELWLDGGHNPAAGAMLAAHMEAHWRDRPLHLICGMMNSKESGDYLKSFSEQPASFQGVAIPGELNSLSAGAMAGVASALGLAAAPANSVEAALKAILDNADERGRVLICGSLYLAGTVLAANG